MPETLVPNVVPSTNVPAAPAGAASDNAASLPAPGTPVVQLPPSPRLFVPRHIAQQEVTAAMKIGFAISAQRIRDRWELDHARAEKQEWVQRVTDLLVHLFGGDSRVADSCNDWVAPILPEFAEVEMFIELFEREMKQRLARLKDVLAELDTAPVVIAVAPQPPPSAAAPVANAPLAAPAAAVAIAMAGAQPPPTAPLPPLRAPDADGSTAVSVTPPAGSPAAPAAEAHAHAPTARGYGVLFSRSGDAPLLERVQKFLASLGVTLRVVAQPSDEPIDLLNTADFTGTSFALVLVDPAELHPGSPSSDDYHFTVGCCVGRLGAPRVTTLTRHDAHLPAPSEQRGVASLSIDATDAWHLPLARQLKKAGAAVDLNKLL